MIFFCSKSSNSISYLCKTKVLKMAFKTLLICFLLPPRLYLPLIYPSRLLPSLLLLKDIKHRPASGPLHLLFSLPEHTSLSTPIASFLIYFSLWSHITLSLGNLSWPSYIKWQHAPYSPLSFPAIIFFETLTTIWCTIIYSLSVLPRRILIKQGFYLCCLLLYQQLLGA